MKWIRISAVWCMSCIVTHSTFLKVKENYPNLTYEEYDYDIDDISVYEVGSILPVHILIKDGIEVCRLVGEVKYSEFEDAIKKGGLV